MYTSEISSKMPGLTRDMHAVYDRGIVKLGRAVICIDCEAISETIHICPSCGSQSLLSLAKILNR